MRFQEEYAAKIGQMIDWKRDVEKKIVDLLKYHVQKPLFIGNMVYDVIKWQRMGNEVEVPAYMYRSEYDNGKRDFHPIYDEENTCEFGWQDFDDCCRIYDVISSRIINKQV